MMATPLPILTDNPIITKHLRSRLRRAQVVPAAVIVATICGLIAWAAYSLGWWGGTGPLGWLVGLQFILLVFIGSAQVGSAVGGARASGIMDFHRVSPLPPLWVAVGFMLGAPIREYLLFALTLPFALVFSVDSVVGWQGLLATEFFLLLITWLLHAVALLSSTVTKKPKATGRGVIGIFIAMFYVMSGLVGNGLIRLPEGDSILGEPIPFFGLDVPWPILFAAYEAVLLVILFIPTVRRLRSERDHLYTKRQAVGSLATIAFLSLAVCWDLKGADYLVVGLLYGLVALGVIFAATITPDRGEYIKGLRGALHAGHRRPSPWSDAGVNRIPLFVLCGIVLVATTIAWEAVEGRAADRGTYSQTIAIGVLTVAYAGLGLQAARLAMRKHGHTVMVTFLFFAWLVPLGVGGLLSASDFSTDVSLAALAISPLAGIVLSTGQIAQADVDPVRIAAIVPPVMLAFVFHALLDIVQRRIDRNVRAAFKQRTPDPFDDVLGVPGRPRDPELLDLGRDEVVPIEAAEAGPR